MISSIAIFAPFNPEIPKPIGNQTTFLIECIKHSKSDLGIILPIFTMEQLQKDQQGVVQGYCYECGKWKIQDFPFPLIIYDRYYSSISGFDMGLESFKDWLVSEKKCRFINPLEFVRMATDKVNFYQSMERYGFDTPDVISFLKYGKESLQSAFDISNNLILKPVFGRMGKSIIRIQRRGINFTICSGRLKLHCRRIDEVMGCVHEIIRGFSLKIDEIIIQPQISIPGFKSRYFDIRSLVQRTDADHLDLTGIVVRVGSKGSYVPNIDQGGLALEVRPWLNKIFEQQQAEEIYRQIQLLSIKIFQRLELEFGPIGEAGLDFLIDDQRRIWIIEANSKPGRVVFQRLSQGFNQTQLNKAHYTNLRRQSVLNPIIYANSIK